MGWKLIWRNNGWQFFKFGENHKLTNSRSWANCKQVKPKEIQTYTHYNKVSQTKHKEKNPVSSQRKTMHYLQGNFSSENHGGQLYQFQNNAWVLHSLIYYSYSISTKRLFTIVSVNYPGGWTLFLTFVYSM